MSISDPVLLIVGLVLTAALAAGAAIMYRRRARALTTAGIAAAGRGRHAGAWLSIAGIAVLAVAMAGPGASLPVPRESGTVILAMDVSNSMGAKDVAPTRLAAAKRAAGSFIAAQPGSVNIGVVAFEEGGLVTERPSSDHSQALTAISRLRTSGGTSLGAAITSSLSAITGKPVPAAKNGAVPAIGYWPSATVVVFSDGQDESAGTAGATAIAEKAGVRVDTVGIGTTAGTTVDVGGYHLFTALNAGTLKQIATATRGSYHPASDASELGSIASTIKLKLTVSKQRLPLAGAFIALALALLAAGAAVTILRSGRVI